MFHVKMTFDERRCGKVVAQDDDDGAAHRYCARCYNGECCVGGRGKAKPRKVSTKPWGGRVWGSTMTVPPSSTRAS